MAQVVFMLVRYVLTAVGGAAAVVSDDTVSQIAGGVVASVCVILAVWKERKSAK